MCLCCPSHGLLSFLDINTVVLDSGKEGNWGGRKGKKLRIISHGEMQIRARGLISGIQKSPGEKELDDKGLEK